MLESKGWMAALFVVACAGCGPKQQPQVGGETHWLAACDLDAHCERGSCICGICSLGCDGDAECEGSTPAACYDRRSPGVGRQCEGEAEAVTNSGICLAVCETDADCQAGTGCIAGACVTVNSDGADAGSAAVGMTVPKLPDVRASEFSSLSPEVDFDTPVAFPLPSFAMPEAARELVGVWSEVDCDPESIYSSCLRIEIAQAAGSGELTGTFVRVPADPADALGPSPRALETDTWYPPGTTVDDYSDLLWHPQSGVDYTILDAEYADGRLSFWVTPLEYWADWCALQSSYPASEVAADEWGRDYFCRPSEQIQSFEDSNSVHPNQAGLTPEALCFWDFSRACDCAVTGCFPAHWNEITLDLVRSADAMEGRVISSDKGTTEVRLRRVER
ncbi:MAG: hypothetical protein OEZ06_30615 [Myxococcales bacterium]|nr:hypothetical protein [Myxococcales bacterium]